MFAPEQFLDLNFLAYPDLDIALAWPMLGGISWPVVCETTLCTSIRRGF